MPQAYQPMACPSALLGDAPPNITPESRSYLMAQQRPWLQGGLTTTSCPCARASGASRGRPSCVWGGLYLRARKPREASAPVDTELPLLNTTSLISYSSRGIRSTSPFLSLTMKKRALGLSVGEEHGGDELPIELGIQRQLVVLDLLG